MRARAELLGLSEGSTTSDQKQRIEAIVLEVDQQSVRVRIPTENAQVTFRSSNASEVVPGHVVTLVVEKRWTPSRLSQLMWGLSSSGWRTTGRRVARTR